jgi:hypothetical protein
MIITLPACTTNQVRQHNSHFYTYITDSGNKQFELSIWSLPNNRLSHNKRDINGKPETVSMAERAGKQHNVQQENKKQAALLDKRLQDILDQNHYCQDGYFTLEHSISSQRSRIRGECHDPASDQDRLHFPNNQGPVPHTFPAISDIPASEPANPIGLSADQTL